MTIEKLNADMISAMKSKDKLRKDTLSAVIGAVKKAAHAILEFHVEDAPELFVQINPFAAPQKVQAVLVAELAQLIPGFAIPFGAEGIPHADEREEVALVARKPAVQLADAGAFGFFARHHARVLSLHLSLSLL